MAHTFTLADLPHTSDGVSFVELRQSFLSQTEIISPFVDQLRRFIAIFRKTDGSEVDIEIALHEALTNAIVHGNREDPHKRVYVTCRCATDGEVSITVRDEGEGFASDMVPDPTAPANWLLTSGRGIYLMKTLMDEVHFEQRGAVVRMRMKANTGSALKGNGNSRHAL